MARKGQEIEIKPRIVNVKEFEITFLTGNEIGFRVLCTKGTYIRSLANDLGENLRPAVT